MSVIVNDSLLTGKGPSAWLVSIGTTVQVRVSSTPQKANPARRRRSSVSSNQVKHVQGIIEILQGHSRLHADGIHIAVPTPVAVQHEVT